MKKTFWQKTISVCLALLMIAALIPAQLVISASAADAVPYIYRYWDGVNVVSETKQCESYTSKWDIKLFERLVCHKQQRVDRKQIDRLWYGQSNSL